MKFYGDLHVHVARSKGAPIKIATSKNLTVLNILEKSILKGIDIVGIVDAASPLVLEEIKEYVQEGTIISS